MLVPAEVIIPPAVETKPDDPKKSRISPKIAIVLPLAFTTIAGGTWLITHRDDLNVQNPPQAPSAENPPSIIEGIISSIRGNTESPITATPAAMPADFESTPMPPRIPRVEELRNIDKNKLLSIWGFTLDDPTKILEFYWGNNPDLLAFTGGDPVRIKTNPKATTSDRHYYYDKCRSDTKLDCVYANERGILISTHSSYNTDADGNKVPLHGELFRQYLEGGSYDVGDNIDTRWPLEERRTREQALENGPFYLIQGDHVVEATVVIVRIPPIENQKIYDAWIEGREDPLDVLIRKAIEIDPELPNKINMNERIIVDDTCGRNVPGEPKIDQPDWQQSSYLVIVGESVTPGITFSPSAIVPS